MIDFIEAKSIANSVVSSFSDASDVGLAIVDDRSIFGPRGWVFFYNSVEYIKHRRPMDALAGNGPIVVYSDGSFEIIASHIKIEDVLSMVGANNKGL